MNNDVVSIIMRSYDCGQFVEETIRSVQVQICRGWELIDFLDNIKCLYN